MGRKRNKKKTRGAKRSAPVVIEQRGSPAAEPVRRSSTEGPWQRFWDGLVLHPAQIRLFRFLFYGLVAIDGFLELEHAPRYGAGGFNVSHFPMLDGLLPVPDRRIMVLLWVLQCFLAVRMALGAGSRRTAAALAGVFGTAYFWSQLDSYQHHYLVFLLLSIAVCVEWGRVRPATWPFRLILAQVSVVYLWAAVTKLHPLWLDGTLIARQIPKGPAPDMVASVAGSLGMEVQALWALVAVAAMGTEVFLAVGLHVSKLRLPALLVGIGLHMGIEYVGFKIGLFSYFMFAIYVLVVPWRWFEHVRPARPRDAEASWWSLGVTLLVGSLAVATLFPIEGIWLAVGVAAGWALVEELPSRSPVGLLHRVSAYAAGCVLILVLHANTDVLRDYWKYRGGDTRRRGEVVQAIEAYEQVVLIDPGYASGHARLSDLYRRRGDLEAALVEAREAEKLKPSESAYPARAARIQRAMGDVAGARQSAQRAMELGSKDEDVVELAR